MEDTEPAVRAATLRQALTALALQHLPRDASTPGNEPDAAIISSQQPQNHPALAAHRITDPVVLHPAQESDPAPYEGEGSSTPAPVNLQPSHASVAATERAPQVAEAAGSHATRFNRSAQQPHGRPSRSTESFRALDREFDRDVGPGLNGGSSGRQSPGSHGRTAVPLRSDASTSSPQEQRTPSHNTAPSNVVARVRRPSHSKFGAVSMINRHRRVASASGGSSIDAPLLTHMLKGAGSAAELLEMVTAHGGSFNHVHVAAAFNQAAKLSAATGADAASSPAPEPRTPYRAVNEPHHHRRASSSGSAVHIRRASSMAAATVSGLQPPASAQALLQSLQPLAMAQLGNMTAREGSQILWALSNLDCPQSPAFISAVLSATISSLLSAVHSQQRQQQHPVVGAAFTSSLIHRDRGEPLHSDQSVINVQSASGYDASPSLPAPAPLQGAIESKATAHHGNDGRQQQASPPPFSNGGGAGVGRRFTESGHGALSLSSTLYALGKMGHQPGALQQGTLAELLAVHLPHCGCQVGCFTARSLLHVHPCARAWKC